MLAWGGGISTSVLSLTLRAFQSHMQEKKASYGILFLDLKSAFYTVDRTFVTGVRAAEDYHNWVTSMWRLARGPSQATLWPTCFSLLSFTPR